MREIVQLVLTSYARIPPSPVELLEDLVELLPAHSQLLEDGLFRPGIGEELLKEGPAIGTILGTFGEGFDMAQIKSKLTNK